MIICFSGTGNSRLVADILQDITGDEIMRFPPGLMRHPERVKFEVYDDRVIWVLPIHSWGMPTIVESTLRHANIFSKNELTHHLVCTCGDDIGYADKIWRKIIEKRNWKPGAAFSIQMPNTYTFMKGFDVDSPEVEKAKLDAVPAQVEHIADILDSGEYTNVTEVVRGSWPWLKTYVIRPWFIRYMTSTKPFHATDACISCSRCAHNCPMGIISMIEGKPVWSAGHCVMCARCYHFCPVHAVEYGKATKGKGQYICPGFSLKK